MKKPTFLSARLLPLVIVILGALFMFILLQFRKPQQRRALPEQPRIVSAVRVVLDTIYPKIIGYGRVSSVQPLILLSEVEGFLQAGQVPFLPGQTFRAGQILLRIDDRQIRLDINTTKSDFLTALANVLPEIKVDFPGQYPRWQAYFNQINFDQDLAPLPAVEDQKIKMLLARFNVYRLYFTIKNLEIRREKHIIRAPFDGAIVSADLRVGAAVRPGTRLGEIVNLARLELEVPLPVSDLSWIDGSREVRLISSEMPGWWTGRVRRMGVSIDPRTQTVPVYIGLVDGAMDYLHTGQFLHAELPGRPIPKAFRVPSRAVYNERFVYLIEHGKLALREVNIVRREENAVVVSGGLENGDTLVVDLLQGVSPGTPARPRLIVPQEEPGQ